MSLPDPRAQPFLTVAEVVAAVPGWGERGVRQAISDGVLKAIRVGHLAVPTAELWRLAGLDPAYLNSEGAPASAPIALTPDPGHEEQAHAQDQHQCATAQMAQAHQVGGRRPAA